MPKQVIDSIIKWKEKKRELPTIPNMTKEQMLDHHSLTYPELATATIEDLGIVNGRLTYEIHETLGTKG